MSANAISILAAQCCLLGNLPIATQAHIRAGGGGFILDGNLRFVEGKLVCPDGTVYTSTSLPKRKNRGGRWRLGQAAAIVDWVDDEEVEPAPGAVLGPVAQPRRHPLKLVNFGGVGAKILKTIVWILAALTVCYLAFLLLAIGIRLANHPGARPARAIAAATTQFRKIAGLRQEAARQGFFRGMGRW